MSRAWRIRALAMGLLVAGAILVRSLESSPAERLQLYSTVAITLGWGHLIGAWAASASRRRDRTPEGVQPGTWLAFRWTALAAVFCAYTRVADLAWIFVALFAVSLWHIVENDLALGRREVNRLRLGPLAANPRDPLLALGWTAALLANLSLSMTDRQALAALPALSAHWDEGVRLGFALLAVSCALAGLRGCRSARAGAGPAALLVAAGWPGPGLPLLTLFSGAVSYHVVCWILLSLEQAAGQGRNGRSTLAWQLRWRLAWTHGLPIPLVGLAVLHPPGLEALPPFVLSPGVYLFWAAAHVAETSWLRSDRLGPTSALAPAFRGR